MTAATIPVPRHRMIRALGRRWPTALGVLTAVVTLGGDVADQVTGLGETLLFLPWIYLVVARSGRRGLSWPVLIAVFPLSVVLRVLDVPVVAVAVPLAAAALAWSVIGHVPRPATVRVQALGMIGFGALALVALAVDTDLGLYLVAAGWLLHGVWDFVHLKLDRAVARSYAEWCGVLDVLTAAYLLLLV
ncbi:hypothetical protein ACTMTJ_43355 [Phytohabitans sp. LJ34]|uniref:hypothetical protein n=1 Tax=Phytohabitans sp. LJ34 TaxID=3452217 RepID=UPI003F8B9561